MPLSFEFYFADVPPFMDATRAFMIMGNLCGISVCILDVVLVIKRINIPEAVIRPLKIGCFSLSCCASKPNSVKKVKIVCLK